MKKFFYVALVAVAAFMVSCKGESNGSEYYKNHELQIDIEAGTVNGKAYDTTTQKCWKTSLTTKTFGVTTTDIEYQWGTEFSVVAGLETGMAAAYALHSIGNTKATYTIEEAPAYKDSESCLANNDKE